MAEASKQTDFSGLGYGDETRRHGDYVGLPHGDGGSVTGSVRPGQAVMVDGGVVAQADGTTAVTIGVLSNYPRAGDSGGPSDPSPITAGQPANVKTSGTVKAEVDSAVSAGDELTPAAGVFEAGTGDIQAVALTDAVEDDRYDGSSAYYAEVLLR